MKNGGGMRRMGALLCATCILALFVAGCGEEGSGARGIKTLHSASIGFSAVVEELAVEEESALEGGEPWEEESSVAARMPDLRPEVRLMAEKNGDTVGWLHIPGIPVDEVVLFKEDDPNNDYYYRRNFYGDYDFSGALYADETTVFGDATSSGLGANTCIYGHCLTDDAGREEYGVRLGPLHDLRDPSVAAQTPYINFSTQEENMTFEIIAVFTANVSNPNLPYNRNPDDPEAFIRMIEEQVYPRSLYHYQIGELSPADKFITLSTPIYYLPDEAQTATNFPLTYLRYGVMGRLIDRDQQFREQADFVVNGDLLVDEDGLFPDW